VLTFAPRRTLRTSRIGLLGRARRSGYDGYGFGYGYGRPIVLPMPRSASDTGPVSLDDDVPEPLLSGTLDLPSLIPARRGVMGGDPSTGPGSPVGSPGPLGSPGPVSPPTQPGPRIDLDHAGSSGRRH